MKLTILENAKNRLVFELDGVDDTFCNLLKDELRKDDAVTVAAYNISHPLVGKPKFFVETSKGNSPKDALDKAVSGLKSTNKALLKEFENMK